MTIPDFLRFFKRKPKVCTLVFPREMGRIFLAEKKLKVGAGLLNGWGGKFDPEKGDKTIEDTARREFAEESGVELTLEDRFEKVGIFNFFIIREHIFVCHVFFCHSERWAGRLKMTEEMGDPEYFDLWGLPLHRMMPADKLFVKRLVDGEKLAGNFYYTEGNKSVEKYDLTALPEEEALAA